MIKKADIIYVSTQGLLFILYFIPISIHRLYIPQLIRYTGILITIIGILVAIIALVQLNKFITPFPTPKKNSGLLKTGVYKYVRHPIYSGIILSSIGYALFDKSLWKFIIAVALWILFYLKSKYEERLLTKHFAGYETYRKSTGRFFPFINSYIN